LVANVFFINAYRVSQANFVDYRVGFSDDLIRAYDLKQMKSAVSSANTVNDRFNKIYEEYLKDKQQPDYAFYDSTGKIDKWWASKCATKLRRIVNIKVRLKDIEHTILALGIKPDVLADKVREKHYEETLADMSNYYSRFIPLEAYRQITNSVD
jgi:hypothetical protein